MLGNLKGLPSEIHLHALAHSLTRSILTPWHSATLTCHSAATAAAMKHALSSTHPEFCPQAPKATDMRTVKRRHKASSSTCRCGPLSIWPYYCIVTDCTPYPSEGLFVTIPPFLPPHTVESSSPCFEPHHIAFPSNPPPYSLF